MSKTGSIRRTGRWLLRLTALFLCISCAYEDNNLEKRFNKSLLQFKSSKQHSLDLNDVLGHEWRKLCIQPAYWSKELFNESSGENLFYVEETSENEIRFWVFYKNGSKRTFLWPTRILDFFGYKNKDGTSKICTTSRSPKIYAASVNGKTIGFYFK